MVPARQFARVIVILSVVGILALTAFSYFFYDKFNWLPLLAVAIGAAVVFGVFDRKPAQEIEDSDHAR